VNVDLSPEAVRYGRESQRALELAGGDLLVQQAEEQPQRREELVVPVLDALGAWELAPRTDPDELQAAAVLCRSAGYFALPYPVAERLSRPLDLPADGMVVVAGRGSAAPISGLDLQWLAVSLAGTRSRAVPQPSAIPVRTSAFVAELELSVLDHDGHADPALGLVLSCWTLLGMLDRAIELTCKHVRDREQFGQPLAAFQGVQFQLTEAEVERCGVDMLAKYALWSVGAQRPEATADALALRLAALEAADVVFRVAHQLHGAQGFCDEVALSWLSRYSQPLRKLPLGLSGTRDHLTRQLGRRGLTGLFSNAEAAI
jgi:hypothetical protein